MYSCKYRPILSYTLSHYKHITFSKMQSDMSAPSSPPAKNRNTRNCMYANEDGTNRFSIGLRLKAYENSSVCDFECNLSIDLMGQAIL